MTNPDQSAAPPAAADGAGRVFPVFGINADDLAAKLAALDNAGPGDEIFAFRWLGEGETPSALAGAIQTEGEEVR